MIVQLRRISSKRTFVRAIGGNYLQINAGKRQPCAAQYGLDISPIEIHRLRRCSPTCLRVFSTKKSSPKQSLASVIPNPIRIMNPRRLYTCRMMSGPSGAPPQIAPLTDDKSYSSTVNARHNQYWLAVIGKRRTLWQFCKKKRSRRSNVEMSCPE